MDANFMLCDKESELSTVTNTLQNASTLILDCEGVNLGAKSGRLTLISLGTAGDHQHAYIIDVCAIGKAGLKPIFDLLESNAVRKVVFDGRMDQSALFHEYSITMQNVVDLQLADVKSRRLRGEDEEEQIGRLSPYLRRGEVRANVQLYTEVHKLAGLGQVLREHDLEVDEEEQKIKARGAAALNWSIHPPSRAQLSYAANDISLISHLWSHFEQENYIDESLPEQSLRYVRMWLNDQPEDGDPYKLHALLPLAILDAAPTYHTTQRCIGCGRDLPQKCFSKAAWNTAAKRKCWVCRAIGIRALR
ncbi:ribonuclease H-like domain-containing protein [Mycena leptocephala]|nr:ribonuclease H-like domain-containing protein [Mycena leptocephala]